MREGHTKMEKCVFGLGYRK